MNNASSSSSHPQPNHLTLNGEHGPNESEEAVPTTGDDGNDPEQERKRVRREQKIKFFNHLIRNFDTLTYCQLWILYYMDTSFLRFLIRAVPHYVYLSPKPVLPPPLPPSPPSPPPSLALILLSNLPPILLHIFTRPPSGSEAARGYLHGGILIDFVGQEAPASKLKLVALDLLVLGLQVAMMALVLERRGLEPPTRPADGSSSAATQDHDAEERGVLLLSSSATETREPPPPPSSAARLSIDRDRNADVREDAGSSSEQHPLDAFRSGQYVVANLRFTNIARDEWLRYKEHVGRSSALESDVRGRSAERRARRNADRGRELEARLRFVAGWR